MCDLKCSIVSGENECAAKVTIHLLNINTMISVYSMGINRYPSLSRQGQGKGYNVKTLQINKENRGASLPNLSDYYYAAQMRYTVYWCSLEYQARWKHIQLNLGQSQLQARLGEKEYTDQNGENTILEESLKITNC